MMYNLFTILFILCSYVIFFYLCSYYNIYLYLIFRGFELIAMSYCITETTNLQTWPLLRDSFDH